MDVRRLNSEQLDVLRAEMQKRYEDEAKHSPFGYAGLKYYSWADIPDEDVFAYYEGQEFDEEYFE